jgi:hypothetical protein
MTSASVMIAWLNAALAALTPAQRWDAMRRLEGDLMTERWFVLAGITAIIVLTALLIAVSYRHAKQRKLSNRLFREFADRLGLTGRQSQILRNIAARSKLERSELIFTAAAAFDRGAAEIVRETLAISGAQRSSRVSAELSVLREKLGFERRRPATAGAAARPSSREIPVGKKLYLTVSGSDNVESSVIKNDDVELAVRLAGAMETEPGEHCCARYNFGASVWEFDAPVVSCHAGILILNHTDDVRFINRRRFLRVPVKQPAFIARFPFARTLPPADEETSRQSKAQASADAWGPPEFVRAEVTEMAGPGLRVQAPLEVKVGERVVVILKLGEQAPSVSAVRSDAVRGSHRMPLRAHYERIVEDIGQVRHAEPTGDGFSIAVELMGLSDSNVNELIRETNAASMNTPAQSTADPFDVLRESQRLRVPPAVMQEV